MFWVTYSLEEWNALSHEEQLAALPYFNGLGGILPESQPLEGARMASIRELTAPTPEAPVNEWILSPDGHIFYNEAELYGGMFTLNLGLNPETQRPIAEETWEESIRGLYQVQVAGQNRTLLARYPSVESFVQAAAEGVLIGNLWIPVRYPGTRREFWGHGAWVPLEGPVDLSSVAIAVARPTAEERMQFNYVTTPYFAYYGKACEVLVERVEIGGRLVLRFNFRSDLNYDFAMEDPDFPYLALREDKSSEENLMAATQLIRSWVWAMQHMGPDVRRTEWNPPLLWPEYPSNRGILLQWQDPEGSLLQIR
jgi:hypothetical protein